MTADKFLSLYVTYENLLRETGREPKDLEGDLSGIPNNRLRMCRLLRNYLVHVADPGFLIVTDKMGAFLEEQVDSLRAAKDTAKKHLKKPEACILSESSKCSDAFEMFSKLKCDHLLVQKKDGSYHMLSLYDIVGAKAGTKVSLYVMKAVRPCFCSPLTEYVSLDTDKVTLCTDDGTKDGKLLGQVWFL